MPLPVLDLRSAGFVDELRQAARDIGFFYLVGHGVPESLAEALFAASRRFFALPESQKLAIQMANTRHFRGYTRLGDELTGGRTDWREQIDFGLEVPALQVGPGDPPWRRLQGPNQWPSEVPELRPLVLEWHERLHGVAMHILEAFAVSLGQPANAFDGCCRGPANQVIKTIRYPGRDAGTSDQGCGAHKDSEFLTLLRQDEVSGLQVETAEGWTDAPPLAGSFVVNTGELLELASDGYYRATVHRVVTPPPGSERLSLAFFLAARLDAVVPHLQLAPKLAAEAPGPAGDPANPLYRDVGPNTLKGRLRSHPDVARRHYADVCGALPR
jgi:isopenicillin N synthase-like dioxygenase